MIGDVAPLDAGDGPVDFVPPPSEPLYELVETSSTEANGASEARSEAPAPSATQLDDGPRGEQTGQKIDRQFGQVFGMLWTLVRSIGPRQNSDDD